MYIDIYFIKYRIASLRNQKGVSARDMSLSIEEQRKLYKQNRNWYYETIFKWIRACSHKRYERYKKYDIIEI